MYRCLYLYNDGKRFDFQSTVSSVYVCEPFISGSALTLLFFRRVHKIVGKGQRGNFSKRALRRLDLHPNAISSEKTVWQFKRNLFGCAVRAYRVELGDKPKQSPQLQCRRQCNKMRRNFQAAAHACRRWCMHCTNTSLQVLFDFYRPILEISKHGPTLHTFRRLNMYSTIQNGEQLLGYVWHMYVGFLS